MFNNIINVNKSEFKFNVRCYRIPVVIELKTYSSWITNRQTENMSFSLKEYIVETINKASGETITRNELRSFLEKLSFLFIFDGLDEVPSTSNRGVLMEKINEFIEFDLKQAICDYYIVATTRPEGYTKEFNNKYFEHFDIEFMTKEECKKFLKKFLNTTVNSTKNRDDYYLSSSPYIGFLQQ